MGVEALLNVSGCDKVAEKQRKEGEKQHRRRFIFCLICELVFAKCCDLLSDEGLPLLYIPVDGAQPVLVESLGPRLEGRARVTGEMSGQVPLFLVTLTLRFGSETLSSSRLNAAQRAARLLIHPKRYQLVWKRFVSTNLSEGKLKCEW